LLSSGVPNDPDRPPIPDLNFFGPNPFTDSPTIRNSAQLHGDYDVFYQYLGQQSNWEYGIAQHSPLEKIYPYTAFKAKTFFKPNQKYNFKIEQNRYYFDDNQGRFKKIDLVVKYTILLKHTIITESISSLLKINDNLRKVYDHLL